MKKNEKRKDQAPLSALNVLDHFKSDHAIVLDIKYLMLSIRAQGIIVHFECHQSHCQIAGNEWADSIAKRATCKKKVDVMVAPSMSELKKEEKLIMLANWQDSWKDSAGALFLRKSNKMLTCTCCLGVIIRGLMKLFSGGLRCGFGKSLNSYFKSIGKHPDGRCDTCYVLDDLKHFLLECKKYASERNYLKQRLEENNQIMNIKILIGWYPGSF